MDKSAYASKSNVQGKILLVYKAIQILILTSMTDERKDALKKLLEKNKDLLQQLGSTDSKKNNYDMQNALYQSLFKREQKKLITSTEQKLPRVLELRQDLKARREPFTG